MEKLSASTVGGLAGRSELSAEVFTTELQTALARWADQNHPYCRGFDGKTICRILLCLCGTGSASVDVLSRGFGGPMRRPRTLAEPVPHIYRSEKKTVKLLHQPCGRESAGKRSADPIAKTPRDCTC